MMGTHQAQDQLFNYQVNLEKRVRRDHPLRRISAVLDLSFVRPAVQQVLRWQWPRWDGPGDFSEDAAAVCGQRGQ